jgi:hypothetical protein
MTTLTFRIKKRPDASAMLLELRHRWNQLAPGETLELSFTLRR